MSAHTIKLGATFCQYDPHRYPGAVERLISLLQGLRGVDSTLLIVDNKNPGPWFHQVSNCIIHIGGDNSAREFSAFDRGLEFANATAGHFDVYAFVTEAFLAYGSDYLNLIDDQTLRYSLEWSACLGWIDSFGVDVSALGLGYRDWIRTSLFFVPAPVLATMAPLTTAIDPALIFSADSRKPFLDAAPLSHSLRDHLLAWLTTAETEVKLDEVWHSQIDLNEETFELFRFKVCAILREQVLSARLRSKEIPCYDFRLIHQLSEEGFDAGAIPEATRRNWQWTAWRGARIIKQPRASVERYTAPSTLVHGEAAELELAGWALTEPQVRELTVNLHDRNADAPALALGVRCDVLRPDVLAEYREFNDERCGYVFKTTLECLPPGTYDIELAVPSTSVRYSLGVLQVLPCCEFDLDRCFLPDSAYPGSRIPISLEGSLRSSRALMGIKVLWNGRETTITPQWVEAQPRSNGLLLYDVSLMGEVEPDASLLQQKLELVFTSGDDGASSWRYLKPVRSSPALPHCLSVREVGDLDPGTGLVVIRLKGAVRSGHHDDRLLLMREGRCLLQEALPRPESPPATLAWFDLERELASIPPGTWTFQLALQSPDDSQPQVLTEWRARVKLLRPRATIDLLEVDGPAREGSPYYVRLSGWVENHFVVDHLYLSVDGEEVASLSVDELRDDVAQHYGEPLIRSQGFFAEVPLNVAAGAHTVKVLHAQGNGKMTLWERSVEFAEFSRRGFHLQSTDLEKLERGKDCTFWSSISFRGEVISELEEVTATLYVDNKAVDQQRLSVEDEFSLRSRPRKSGTYRVRVVFVANERTLYDSGVVEVTFEKLALPRDLPPMIDRFMKRFQIRGRLGVQGATQDVLPTLLENDKEGISDYVTMIRGIDLALANTDHSSGMPTARPRARSKKDASLRVLLASWEVPCGRHGGGVWMKNLLRAAADRHEITLVHGHDPDEGEWVEEVRSYVHKVISVVRKARPRRGPDPSTPSSYLYREYIPELRRAVEAEVFTGTYDLVDYQYVWMYPYVSYADVPRVMTVFEEPFSARLASYTQHASSDDGKVDRLDSLLRMFYFSAVLLPRAFPHLIAVTEADARFLRRYQNQSRIHVNGIGVHADSFQRPGNPQGENADGVQRLVFLGNYRHPPSVDAAVFFAQDIMPSIWSRHPEAEFVIVGASPTDEVLKLGEIDRISVTGFVPDYRPYLWQASAFVAPIFTGAGMRVKLLEAMACGAPVVATRLAMEGIKAVNGRHYLRAQTQHEFVEAACRCMEAPAEARRMGSRAQALIAKQHDYAARAQEREAIWRTVVDDWRAGCDGPTVPR